MSAVAIPKSAELVGRLNAAKKEKRKLSEFELRQYRVEAEKLRHADPVGSFTVLGIIASFTGDLESVNLNFQKVLALSDDPIERNNYSLSLWMCGDYENALRFAKEAYEGSTDPLTTKDALNSIIELCEKLEREEEFIDYAYEWESLYGSPHRLMAEDVDDEIISDTLGAFEEEIRNNRKGFVELDPSELDECHK